MHHEYGRLTLATAGLLFIGHVTDDVCLCLCLCLAMCMCVCVWLCCVELTRLCCPMPNTSPFSSRTSSSFQSSNRNGTLPITHSFIHLYSTILWSFVPPPCTFTFTPAISLSGWRFGSVGNVVCPMINEVSRRQARLIIIIIKSIYTRRLEVRSH